MATILILDDSPTNRSIYARLATMVEDGVITEVFADPLDALEWLEHNRAELVITDFKMPGMDGAAFTRCLRALPAMARTPILVVTAHDDRSFRVRALDAGATDFLQSPIDHFEFVTRARNLLALGRQPAEGWAPGLAEPLPAPPRPEALTGFARILDALPAMVSATDTAGAYVNAAFAAWQGARPGDILGSSVLAVLGSDRGVASRGRDLAVFESGRPLAPYREVLADAEGTQRVLLTAKTPLRDTSATVVAVLTTSFLLPDDGGGVPLPGTGQ
jgi:CheY-like chemotaxis protein